MFEDFKKRIKGKRYQELSMPYRIVLWLMYMPLGYMKGLSWYFVDKHRLDDNCDRACCRESEDGGKDKYGDDEYYCNDHGRMSLDTCIGICIGTAQVDMGWYYTMDEIFNKDGTVINRDIGYFKKTLDFVQDKLVEIVDGKRIKD